MGAPRIHGYAGKIPEYRIWRGIRERCLNPDSIEWDNYGGRGITMSKRWQDSFQAFLDDVGRRPTKNHSLDRINNARGYFPSNCRWATRKEQSRNRDTNRNLRHGGLEMTIQEWAERTGIPASTIRMRIDRGWTVREALTTPARHYQWA